MGVGLPDCHEEHSEEAECDPKEHAGVLVYPFERHQLGPALPLLAAPTQQKTILGLVLGLDQAYPTLTASLQSLHLSRGHVVDVVVKEDQRAKQVSGVDLG